MENKNKNGYALLLSVIVIGAIGLLVSVFMLSHSVSSGQTFIVQRSGTKASLYAEACAESALQEIRDTTSFVGSNSISFSDGSCQYQITSLGGQNRQIVATGAVAQSIKTVTILLSKINPDIVVDSWE